jgi:hypothetical protein
MDYYFLLNSCFVRRNKCLLFCFSSSTLAPLYFYYNNDYLLWVIKKQRILVLLNIMICLLYKYFMQILVLFLFIVFDNAKVQRKHISIHNKEYRYAIQMVPMRKFHVSYLRYCPFNKKRNNHKNNYHFPFI